MHLLVAGSQMSVTSLPACRQLARQRGLLVYANWGAPVEFAAGKVRPGLGLPP